MTTDALAIADELARDLAETAVERDHAGGTAARERERIRASGLLRLSIPRAHGGLGASWSETLAVVRRIARADGSLAHLFGFHHLLVATVRLFGTPAQWTRAYEETAARAHFWGNALNPRDPRTIIRRDGDGWRVDGAKSFCSGARGSDVLVISALDGDRLVVAAIPTRRAGVTIHDDWDAFGQRQTDSGTVELAGVEVRDDELLRSPGPLGSPFASIRPLLSQLVLVNVYVGLAEGALDAARAHRRADATDDPYLLRHAGAILVGLEASRALADRAAARFDQAWARGEAIDARGRGELAIAIAAAKAHATQTGLDVATRLFDLTGARATSARLGLDRFWRNLRTHTLHDPVDHKLRELGAFALADAIPTPSFYS